MPNVTITLAGDLYRALLNRINSDDIFEDVNDFIVHNIIDVFER